MKLGDVVEYDGGQATIIVQAIPSNDIRLLGWKMAEQFHSSSWAIDHRFFKTSNRFACVPNLQDYVKGKWAKVSELVLIANVQPSKLGDRVKVVGVEEVGTVVIIDPKNIKKVGQAVGFENKPIYDPNSAWNVSDTFDRDQLEETISNNKRWLVGDYQKFKWVVWVNNKDLAVIGTAPPAIVNGCACKRCGEYNDYAAPNQPDGKFLCFGCRTNPFYGSVIR
jgi:hypothetical protein